MANLSFISFLRFAMSVIKSVELLITSKPAVVASRRRLFHYVYLLSGPLLLFYTLDQITNISLSVKVWIILRLPQLLLYRRRIKVLD